MNVPSFFAPGFPPKKQKQKESLLRTPDILKKLALILKNIYLILESLVILTEEFTLGRVVRQLLVV